MVPFRHRSWCFSGLKVSLFLGRSHGMARQERARRAVALSSRRGTRKALWAKGIPSMAGAQRCKRAVGTFRVPWLAWHRVTSL